jgi:hypothetical protein
MNLPHAFVTAGLIFSHLMLPLNNSNPLTYLSLPVPRRFRLHFLPSLKRLLPLRLLVLIVDAFLET